MRYTTPIFLNNRRHLVGLPKLLLRVTGWRPGMILVWTVSRLGNVRVHPLKLSKEDKERGEFFRRWAGS